MDSAIDRDIERTAADFASGLPAHEVILGEYGFDLAKVGVLALVAEPDFLAVGEEDEGHAEEIGVAPPLGFARAQGDARALGFEHGERAPLAIEQDVVGPPTILDRVLDIAR